MKLLFLVAVMSALLLPSPADAWHGGRFRALPQIQAQRADQDREQLRRGGRGAKRDERRSREELRRGRLTEKERRELHRDLDRAQREIYRRDRKR